MAALRLGWCSREIGLVVHVVTSVGLDTGWRAERSPSRIRIREQIVVRNGAGRASKDCILEVGVERGQDLCQGTLSCLSSTSNEERSDGVEALINKAENGGGVEVWCAELSNWHGDWVFGVDVEETLGDGFDGTVLGGAAVPVFRPPLWDVLKLVGLSVVFRSDDGANGFVVCNSASAVCAVGEEVWVESESCEGDDGWEGDY